MKDLGLLNYFFGLEVTSNLNGYFLSQAKYASDPLEVNAKFSLAYGTSFPDATLCRQLVGSLIYTPDCHKT